METSFPGYFLYQKNELLVYHLVLLQSSAYTLCLISAKGTNLAEVNHLQPREQLSLFP